MNAGLNTSATCAGRADFSAILILVQRAAGFGIFLIGIASIFAAASAQQQQLPPAPPAQNPLQAPLPPAQPTLSVVVLDPAHGGADAGARGPSGVLESEIVLEFARAARTELERQGLRVVITRQGNDNPTFDDRAAAANSQHGAVFISLHVSSNGPAGIVRVYSLPPAAAAPTNPATPAERPGLIPWNQAQRAYLDRSRRLAEFAQIQLAQRFRGTPETPATAEVRQLRTVAAPAIAVEVSSVAVGDRSRLAQMAPALAEALARAVTAFRAVYEAGAK